jgi:hypothetical protein
MGKRQDRMKKEEVKSENSSDQDRDQRQGWGREKRK